MVVRVFALLGALGVAASAPAAAEQATRPPPERGPAPGSSQPASAPKPEPKPAPGAATGPNPPRAAATGAVARSGSAKPGPAPPEPVKVSQNPHPTLGPETFLATVKAAERYREIVEAGGWPRVANEATRLRLGDRSPHLAALRRRLQASADLPETETGDTFDPALAAALTRFQARHGIEETGFVGPRTLAQLNVPAAERLRALQASAARLLGSRFPFGDRYLVVNIPSATVEAVEGGAVRRRHVAVVGKRDRPSPAVETRVTSVNLNPTWTVPVSLIRKDVIPQVRKDPGYLAKMKIRLFNAAGEEVDPGTIDWAGERAVNYTIRQDPGAENSLGEVRLDMPNRHAVYMHDTPSKGLFAREFRAHSSGCVRVAGVKDLAAWLLAGTAGPDGPGSEWGRAEIAAAVATGARRDIRLAAPVPVIWVYLTGYAGADGAVHFRDDIYRLDEPAPPAADPAAPATIGDLITSSIAPPR